MADNVRLGIFGGSFDPVHRGHLQLAILATKEFNLEKVFFVPARQPPHKKGKKLTPARDRMAMLSKAIEPYPRFTISRFELERKSTTYTYQTLNSFKRQFPSARLFFLMGSDSLAELHTWKNAAALARLCDFIVGVRKGAPKRCRLALANKVHYISRPILPISSSLVRERVQSGRPIKRLVPPAVERYIENKKLYR
jgi:nicotinate-nucleotide adenylyltransferase